MSIDTTQEALAPVRKIMDRHESHCSQKIFYKAADMTSHNFEAAGTIRRHMGTLGSGRARRNKSIQRCASRCCVETPTVLPILVE